MTFTNYRVIKNDYEPRTVTVLADCVENGRTAYANIIASVADPIQAAKDKFARLYA